MLDHNGPALSLSPEVVGKRLLKENMGTMLVDTCEKVSEVDDYYMLCRAGVVYWENGTY